MLFCAEWWRKKEGGEEKREVQVEGKLRFFQVISLIIIIIVIVIIIIMIIMVHFLSRTVLNVADSFRATLCSGALSPKSHMGAWQVQYKVHGV
jgi:amino acid transporter